MQQSTSRNRFRACLLIASLVCAPLVFADVVEFTPAVPPADSVYTLPDTCISVVCLENLSLTDFNVTSSSIVGGNQVTVANVDLKANVFQNVSGAPGPFISPIVLSGQADITFLSKDTLSSLGTFTADLTALNLSGSFVGLTGPHQVDAMLNPLEPSTGQTTVEMNGGKAPAFGISSSFDVFAELSVDSGPFVPGPERVGDLTQTPEPAYYGVIGVALVAMVIRRAVKPKRRSAA